MPPTIHMPSIGSMMRDAAGFGTSLVPIQVRAGWAASPNAAGEKNIANRFYAALVPIWFAALKQ